MSRRLRIYHAERDGAALALTIELAGDGTVTLTPGDDSSAAAFVTRLVGEGVDVVAPASTESGLPEFRLVTRDAGAAYLDAVRDMLGQTSRWIVVPE
jgi:hypothetical protein